MGDMINWMGGWPKEGLLSAAEWEARLAAEWEARLSAEAAPADEAEASGQGLRELRERMALDALLTAPGTDASGLVLAPGADAALDRVARAWLEPGDAVLVERPTSRSALQIFRKAGVIPHETASDRFGMLPEELARSVAALQPRLVYAAPRGTDPEGRIWDGGRRRAMLRICAEAGVPVLLDERQAWLRYDEEALPEKGPAASGAEDGGADGIVWTVGELPPGLIGGQRFGWLNAGGGPTACRERLLAWRGGAAAEVPMAEQLAMRKLLASGELEPLLMAMRFVCRAKVGRLIEELERLRLPGLGWHEPEAGMHLWLTLPEGMDGDALLRAAWLNGLLFQPGGAFYAARPERSRLRLTPVHADERQLRAGVARLAETMEAFLGRSV